MLLFQTFLVRLDPLKRPTDGQNNVVIQPDVEYLLNQQYNNLDQKLMSKSLFNPFTKIIDFNLVVEERTDNENSRVVKPSSDGRKFFKIFI